MARKLLADKLDNVKESATLKLNAKAKGLKAQGHPVINFTVGEPDFDTPEFVREAAKVAIDKGQTRYTPVAGTEALRKAVAEKFKRENNLDYTPAQITVGTGGKQVLANAFFATLNPGDEVIIPAPYWVSYPEMVTLFGGTPVIVQTRAEEGFKMTPAALEAAIRPNTKWVVLNTIGNPTGEVYSREELAALGAVVKKYPDLYVLSDDIYEHLLYNGKKFATIAEVVPELYDRTLTMNGASKGYAMTGWRIGYAGGPQNLIEGMNKIQGQYTSNTSSISQAAALAALEGDQSFLNGWRAAFKKRRDLAAGMLNDAIGITCRVPEGAFYVFPSCAAVFGKVTEKGKKIENDTDFANYLLDEYYVAVVPGTEFGAPGFFRISYALDDADLKEGCTRIQKACSALKPAEGKRAAAV